jgi:hypothetical protein
MISPMVYAIVGFVTAVVTANLCVEKGRFFLLEDAVVGAVCGLFWPLTVLVWVVWGSVRILRGEVSR